MRDLIFPWLILAGIAVVSTSVLYVYLWRW